MGQKRKSPPLNESVAEKKAKTNTKIPEQKICDGYVSCMSQIKTSKTNILLKPKMFLFQQPPAVL